MRKLLPCVYRTQRDNADRSGSSCNTTSAVMFLEASGHPPSEMKSLPGGTQPEDWLSLLGDSPAAYRKMRDLCPWFFDAAGKPIVRPPEAPLMLDWIVEQRYGRALQKYSENITFAVMMEQIDLGRAVLAHGLLTPEGHYVAVVGYEVVEDIGGKPGQLTDLIIDDPWGNYLTAYSDFNGEHIALPLERAISVLKPVHSVTKSGHLVVG
jgi:hypothetical protein